MSTTVQKQLVKWGFVVCDDAMRKHVDLSLSAPETFPYPEVGLG